MDARPRSVACHRQGNTQATRAQPGQQSLTHKQIKERGEWTTLANARKRRLRRRQAAVDARADAVPGSNKHTIDKKQPRKPRACPTSSKDMRSTVSYACWESQNATIAARPSAAGQQVQTKDTFVNVVSLQKGTLRPVNNRLQRRGQLQGKHTGKNAVAGAQQRRLRRNRPIVSRVGRRARLVQTREKAQGR